MTMRGTALNEFKNLSVKISKRLRDIEGRESGETESTVQLTTRDRSMKTIQAYRCSQQTTTVC